LGSLLCIEGVEYLRSKSSRDAQSFLCRMARPRWQI
jgi:hypothetical protein